MFSREEFEAYSHSYEDASVLCAYHREAAKRVMQFLQLPTSLLRRELYVEALLASEEALTLVRESGATGFVLERARALYDSTREAIDLAWRTLAFVACKVSQSGPLTLVELGDEGRFLFGEPLLAVPSADASTAMDRARLIDSKRSAAIEEARLDLLYAYEHVGQDDRTLRGTPAHELVEEAVERRLLDWNDASWFWPWQFPERVPAGAVGAPIDHPFASWDANA